MSDAAQVQQTQPDVLQQQSTQPPPGSERGAYSSGLKFEAAPGVPDWAIGRTPKEIIEIAETYRGIATSNLPPQQVQYQPPSQAAFSYQQPNAPQFPAAPDPQLMYSAPEQYQAQAFAYQQHMTQAAMQQAAMPLVRNMAVTARSLAEQRDTDVFKRYGHEIDAEINRLPMEMRNAEAYELAINMVRGKHWRELAREEADRLNSNQGTGLERGAGAPGMPLPSLDPLDELFANPPETFKAAGMTKSDVLNYCQKTGRNVNEYAKSVLGGNVLTARAS
jgi:hypothetical protein